MSKLEELIQELCPDGVEYRTLGSLGKFYGGLSGKSKDDFKNGNEKFITYKNIFDNIALKTDITETVKVAPNEKQNIIQYGDILFTGSSETPDECGMSSVLTEHVDDKLYLNSFCFGYRFTDSDCNLLPGFSKYLFRSEALRKQIKRTASGVTRFNVSKKKMVKVMIPIPPLEVQREIVRILDTFTELTEELDAELTARRKQYEYYSSKLFTDTIYDLVPMSELAEFVYGYTAKANDYGNTRFIRITDINEQGYLSTQDTKYIMLNDEAKKNLLSKGDLIMARTGATYGKTLYFDSDEQSVYASFLIKIIPDKKRLNNRFYWHFTKTPLYWEQAKKLVSAGGQPQFNTPALKQIKVPVPPLDEQRRIVSILDRFDALCNDLTSGLPAEIEARRKQYEYYRDKLLSFPPAEKGEES